MAFYLGTEEPFFNETDVYAYNSEVQAIKTHVNVMFEFGPQLIYTMDRVQPFRKHPPVSEQDSADGRICTKSGMWFPARLLVWIGGLPYGQEYAPKERPTWLKP